MTPADDYHGTANITVNLDDGNGGLDDEVFTLTVTSVNDAPVLTDINDQETVEGVPITIVLSASDVEGDELTFSTESDNLEIITSINGSQLALTAGQDYNGNATITVLVTDAGEMSNEISFAFTIDAVNDDPVAVDDIADVDEDGSVSGNVMDNDSDLDADYNDPSGYSVLSVSLVDSPSNGSLNLNTEGLWDYTPNADWYGTDNFVYELNDEAGGSDRATVTITVNPINDAPGITDIVDQVTDEDIPLTVILSASDVDGDDLIFTAESDDENVTVVIEDDELTLIPAENWYGNVTISVTVSDGFLTDEETFALTVNPVNDAPVLTIDVQEMEEDDTITVDLSAFAFDDEGDSLEYVRAVSADE